MNSKRRRVDNGNQDASNGAGTPSSIPTLLSLPARPTNDVAAKADSIGLGGPKTAETEQMAPTAVQALAGSNRDVVANRRFIRMANMSAAEVLKAELAGLVPVKKSASSFQSTATPAVPTPPPASASSDHNELPPAMAAAVEDDDTEVPGLGGTGPVTTDEIVEMPDGMASDADHLMDEANPPESPHGVKRKHDVVEEEDAQADEADDTVMIEEDDDEPADAVVPVTYTLKVNPDGTVEQEDTVK